MITGRVIHNMGTVRDLAPEVLDERGRMRILPAAFWCRTTRAERAVFGHRYGIYSIPTVELVDRLREIIDGRKAIEIGAGNGVLAQALEITATDSREQEKASMRQLYAMTGQPTVQYGTNVEKYEAMAAVRRFKPQVVLGCWVTQNYDPREPWRGDSKANGVDEDVVIDSCETYVFVGNQEVHKAKRIWQRPHTVEHWPWLYSRASNGSPNFIGIWQGGKR